MHEIEPNAANAGVFALLAMIYVPASEAISCRSLPIRLFSGRYQRRVLSIAGKRRLRGAFGSDSGGDHT